MLTDQHTAYRPQECLWQCTSYQVQEQPFPLQERSLAFPAQRPQAGASGAHSRWGGDLLILPAQASPCSRSPAGDSWTLSSPQEQILTFRDGAVWIEPDGPKPSDVRMYLGYRCPYQSPVSFLGHPGPKHWYFGHSQPHSCHQESFICVTKRPIPEIFSKQRRLLQKWSQLLRQETDHFQKPLLQLKNKNKSKNIEICGYWLFRYTKIIWVLA